MSFRGSVVVDTNVLVSAMLKAGSVPDRLLTALLEADITLLYDDRMAREYRAVAARPKLQISAARASALLDPLFARATRLANVTAYEGPLIDDSDRDFIEVALSGKASAIVTGNLKHFPAHLGFAVHPPAALLALLTLDD